ncbi:MAG: hypothetical protein ACRC7O_15530, partial [Fimbriiglobus sp.]
MFVSGKKVEPRVDADDADFSADCRGSELNPVFDPRSSAVKSASPAFRFFPTTYSAAALPRFFVGAGASNSAG